MIHVLTHRRYHSVVVALMDALERRGLEVSAGPVLPGGCRVVFPWGYRYAYLEPTLRDWCKGRGACLVNGIAEPSMVVDEPPGVRLFVVDEAVRWVAERGGEGGAWARFEPPRSWCRQAVAAARGAGAAIALVERGGGPAGTVQRLRFARLPLLGQCGPRAVGLVADHLAVLWRETPPPLWPPEQPMVELITGLPERHPRIDDLLRALQRRGLDVRVGAEVPVDAGRVLLWGTTWRHLRREAQRCELLGVAVAQGGALTLEEQRARLHEAGLPVPRWRLAGSPRTARRCYRSVAAAVRWTHERDPDALHSAGWASSPEDLSGAAERPVFMEEASLATHNPLRCWVADGRVLHAEPAELGRAERYTAERACRALGLAVAEVQLVRFPGDDLRVWRVRHRDLSDLPEPIWEAAREALAAAACRADRSEPEAIRPLRVLVPRPLGRRPGNRRVWHIHALVRALSRQGHEVVFSPEGLPADGAFDLVLQDPAEAMGRRVHSDSINRILYRDWRRRGHLLRDPQRRTLSNKADMQTLARTLGLRAPPVLDPRHLRPEDLPVVVKPVAGSLGIGVHLARTLERLPKGTRSIVQRYIDSGLGYAVTIRAVSVRSRIVSAALFFRKGLRSNLSQGAHAVALVGPGVRWRPSPREHWLLTRVGIDPEDRRVPDEVARMAARVGRYYAARGVQMLGQDYVVDAEETWWFLEVNLAFGLRVFNVTHGSGTSSGRGAFRIAGEVLARGIVEALDAGGRGLPRLEAPHRVIEAPAPLSAPAEV